MLPELIYYFARLAGSRRRGRHRSERVLNAEVSYVRYLIGWIPVFEALDDAWTMLGARYFAITRGELERESATRLQEWVESKKLSITHVTFRQKEHWEQTGGNPNKALSAICDGLNASKGGVPK
jgi:hypothetical protein